MFAFIVFTIDFTTNIRTTFGNIFEKKIFSPEKNLSSFFARCFPENIFINKDFDIISKFEKLRTSFFFVFFSFENTFSWSVNLWLLKSKYRVNCPFSIHLQTSRNKSNVIDSTEDYSRWNIVSNEGKDFDFVDPLLIERSDTRDVDRWRRSIEEYSDEHDEHDNYLRRFQLVWQIKSILMDRFQACERSAEIHVNEIDSMECFYKKDNDCFFRRNSIERVYGRNVCDCDCDCCCCCWRRCRSSLVALFVRFNEWFANDDRAKNWDNFVFDCRLIGVVVVTDKEGRSDNTKSIF